MWQSNAFTEAEALNVDIIENGYLLSSRDAKLAVGRHRKEANSERIAPFAHATQPLNQLVRIDYAKRCHNWFENVEKEKGET